MSMLDSPALSCPDSASSATASFTTAGPQVLAELMARVRVGDETAFCDLYALTRVQLAAIILRTVRATDHASEVLQEVYLYVWENARSYDPTRGTVLGWLSMISFRRAVDRVRSVTRSAARDHRSTVDSDGDVIPDVADLSIARHDAACLRRALQLLSSKQRHAVALTYLGGYTHQEAADLLGVPLGTLKTRVRDGVTSLRAQLAVPTVDSAA